MPDTSYHVKSSKLACLALAFAALSACGAQSVIPGPSGGSPPGLAGAVRSTVRGYLSLRIRIPKHERRSGASPRYISPGTESIAIAILNASHTTVASAAQNLTPGSPNCTPAGGSPATCTISMAVFPGSYSANITTYAQTGETGSVLSQTSGVPVKIVAGTTNGVAVVLDGVPAFVQIVPEVSSATLGGTQILGFQMAGLGAQTIDVFGRDADGNVILGAGAPVVGLASNSSHLVVKATGQANPNQFVLTRSGTQSTAITLTASATPAGGGTAATATASLSFVPLVYLFQAGGIGEYAPWSDSPVRVLTAGLSGTSTYSPFFQQSQILALDGAGNLYALDVPANDVVVYPPGGDRPSRIVSNGINGPSGMALDASGNLYVDNSSSVTVYAAGTATLSRTITSGISFPDSLAFDSSGDLFVSNFSASNVVKYAPGASTPSLTISSGIGDPYGVALDAANNVYVGSAYNPSANNAVTQYAPGSASIAQTYTLGPSTIFTSDYVGGIAVDPQGDFCVAAPTRVVCGNYGEGGFVSYISGFPATTNTDFSNAMTFDAADQLYVVGGTGGTSELRVFPSFDGDAFAASPTPLSVISGSTLVFGVAVQD